MYLEYWNLNRNPFDNVPDPGMYYQNHEAVEGTVAELLFAIEEGNECLAVVVGEVGLGKTMSLRVVLNELDPERYRIAFVTNPDLTFAQLLREIIGQLVGKTCTIRGRDQLLEEFNRLLFETADAGRRVLVFIDEGNALRSSSLEGLRLLTNMQEDDRNLLTLIVAGQPKLGKMLEDPRRTNLFQRIGVYARLTPLDTVAKVRSYVSFRLQQAGQDGELFDEEAIEALFRHSDGIPRLVNRLCKLALKSGETNRLDVISGELVEGIADRFEPKFRMRTRSRKKSRKTTSRRASKAAAEPHKAEVAAQTGQEVHPDPADIEREVVSAKTEEVPNGTGALSETATPVLEQDSLGADEAPLESVPHEETLSASAPSPSVTEEAEPELQAAQDPEEPAVETAPSTNDVDQPGDTPMEELRPAESAEASALSPLPPPANGNGSGPEPAAVPVQNNGTADPFLIPSDVVEALRNLTDERQKLRLAGQLAARQIQEHPERYTGATLDPVRAWDQLREAILMKVS